MQRTSLFRRIATRRTATIVVALAGVLSAGASLSAQTLPRGPSPTIRVAISGTWSGGDWGEVVLRVDGSGTYDGTFGTGPGRLHFECRSDGSCRGVWGESSRRFGTLVFALSPDGTIRGSWTPDPQSTIGSRTGGPIVWTRRPNRVATPDEDVRARRDRGGR